MQSWEGDPSFGLGNQGSFLVFGFMSENRQLDSFIMSVLVGVYQEQNFFICVQSRS